MNLQISLESLSGQFVRPQHVFPVSSHERLCVSDHRLLGCLFTCLPRLTIKKTTKFRITGPSWGESTGLRWIPLTKGQWCGFQSSGLNLFLTTTPHECLCVSNHRQLDWMFTSLFNALSIPFPPRSADPLCYCGYPHSEHSDLAQRSEVASVKEWSVYKNTMEEATTAYGDIEFVGFGQKVSKVWYIFVGFILMVWHRETHLNTKEPIRYRGPSGDWTHYPQTEATPPAAVFSMVYITFILNGKSHGKCL